jgi:hypothetical protein
MGLPPGRVRPRRAPAAPDCAILGVAAPGASPETPRYSRGAAPLASTCASGRRAAAAVGERAGARGRPGAWGQVGQDESRRAVAGRPAELPSVRADHGRRRRGRRAAAGEGDGAAVLQRARRQQRRGLDGGARVEAAGHQEQVAARQAQRARGLGEQQVVADQEANPTACHRHGREPLAAREPVVRAGAAGVGAPVVREVAPAPVDEEDAVEERAGAPLDVAVGDRQPGLSRQGTHRAGAGAVGQLGSRPRIPARSTAIRERPRQEEESGAGGRGGRGQGCCRAQHSVGGRRAGRRTRHRYAHHPSTPSASQFMNSVNEMSSARKCGATCRAHIDGRTRGAASAPHRERWTDG